MFMVIVVYVMTGEKRRQNFFDAGVVVEVCVSGIFALRGFW